MTKVTIDVPDDSTVALAILINNVQREILTIAVKEFTKKLESAPDSKMSTIYLESAREIEKQLADHDSSTSLTREVESCIADVPDWSRPSNKI